MAVNVKPMANGSNPQPAVRSLAEKPHRHIEPAYPLEARHTILRRIVRRHTLKTGNRPHPDRTVFGFENGFHPILARFPLQVILGCRGAIQSQQLRSTHPQVPAAVFMNGVHGNLRHAVRAVDALETFFRQPEQSVIRANPDLSLGVLLDRAHKSIGQSIAGREGAVHTIPITNQAASFAPDPQRVVA